MINTDGEIPRQTDMSDSEAVSRASAGDASAFQLLYERYVTKIYNYIFYRTGHSFEAEDITSKVFFRAFRNIKTYRDMGLPFSAWLYRIAHNLVANWHRDNSRRKEVPLEDRFDHLPSMEQPEPSMVHTQEIEGLLAVIRKLSPERQHLLILKFVEQISNAEIAVIMGKSEGAIKSLYHRTLLAIKKDLEEIAGEVRKND